MILIYFVVLPVNKRIGEYLTNMCAILNIIGFLRTFFFGENELLDAYKFANFKLPVVNMFCSV